MSVCERAATRLVAANTEAQIMCPEHAAARGGRYQLGRVTVKGFALWCRCCSTEHLIPWAEMERIRHLLRFEE